MQITIANETLSPTLFAEKRVALTPDAIQRLVKKYPGLKIAVENNAGSAAGYPDSAYTKVGADVVKKLPEADLHIRIAPAKNLPAIKKQGVVISLTPSASHHALALEKLPRTSRAQALDVLSSQANIAGYAAVLHAAQYFPRLLPMFMTAAGSSRPANVLVLGVGVAGLQAIATARRLGAQVFAYDVRPEVAEQIISLGAKPVGADVAKKEGQGGYAKELSVEEQQAQQLALAGAIAAADIVITTAQVPGRPAPILVSADAVSSMKAGSILLDMAAGGYNAANGIKGGNCPLSRADEIVVTDNAVTLVAPTNLASHVPGDASRFFAQNMVNLLALLFKQAEGQLSFDFSDELIAAMHIASAN